MSNLAVRYRIEEPEDGDAIQRLHERAFGPGRFARTAFRLRERADATPELCFAALIGTMLVGSLRMSPLLVGGRPGLVLGPLAVEPAFEGRGIGAALIDQALVATRRLGHGIVLLVGDEPYYGRFGFRRVSAGRLVMPAPVDPARLLMAELVPGAADEARGRVTGLRC